MGVGDGKAVGGVGDIGRVTRHAHFLHRIVDGHALAVHVQTGEAARPAVVRVEGERFAGDFHAVGQQPDGDCIRAHAVLVVRVVPDLFNGKIHTLRLVRHLYRYAVGKEVGEVGKPRPVQLGVLLAAFQGVIAALFHHQVSPAGVGLHKGDGFPRLLQAGIGVVLSVPGIFQMHAQRAGAFGYVLGVVAVDGVAAGAVGYGVIGRMIGHAVDRLEGRTHRPCPDDSPPRLVHKGRIRVKLHRIGRRRVKFGGDVVERHVDFVVRGKGPHAADQIARFKAHAHAVVRRAGVHVNAGVVHHHRDGGAVFQIARRRARFDQVVVALREQLVVAEDEPPARAREAGQQGVAGGGIAAVRQRHIVHGVERKGRAFERPILLVHFQHAQLVAEVGHIEVGKELALHAGILGKRVHEPGVVTVDVLHGVRLGIVVEHAVFGAVAPVCGKRVIVFGNIAGQLVNRDLPGAAGTQLKPAGVSRQGRPNVLPAAASLDLPSVDGVAVDGPPVVAVLHEDHAEHLPWRCARKIYGFNRRFAHDSSGGGVEVNAVAQREQHAGGGVGARAPGICRKEDMLFSHFGKAQAYGARRAISVRGARFREGQRQVRLLPVLRVQLIDGEGEGVRVFALPEHEPPVRPRRAGSECFGHGLSVLRIGYRKLKFGPCKGVAGLVHLDDGALRDGYQIVFEREVGVRVAPLQIEEIQRMVGVVGQGIALGAQQGPERLALRCAVDLDYAGRKVDLDGSRVVDAAQVRHQHPVDEDPHVVVAGKLIGDRLCPALVHIAAVLLDKARGHVDAEIMVERRVGGVRGIHQGIMPLLRRVCSCFVEGEELADVAGGAAGAHARVFVQGEGVVARIIDGIVLCAVKIVVSVFVHLQEPLRVFVARLPIHRDRRVEQICQRFAAAAGSDRLVLCGARIDGKLWISVCQSALYDPRPWRRIPRPLVPIAIAIIAKARAKEQRMVVVDAAGEQVGRVHVVGVTLRGDPVVEQVDGRAVWRNAVDDVIGIGRLARGQSQRKGEHGACAQQDAPQDGEQNGAFLFGFHFSPPFDRCYSTGLRRLPAPRKPCLFPLFPPAGSSGAASSAGTLLKKRRQKRRCCRRRGRAGAATKCLDNAYSGANTLPPRRHCPPFCQALGCSGTPGLGAGIRLPRRPTAERYTF